MIWIAIEFWIALFSAIDCIKHSEMQIIVTRTNGLVHLTVVKLLSIQVKTTYRILIRTLSNSATKSLHILIGFTTADLRIVQDGKIYSRK